MERDGMTWTRGSVRLRLFRKGEIELRQLSLLRSLVASGACYSQRTPPRPMMDSSRCPTPCPPRRSNACRVGSTNRPAFDWSPATNCR